MQYLLNYVILRNFRSVNAKSFVMFIRSHGTTRLPPEKLRKILYRKILLKCFDKVQFGLKSDKYNRIVM